MHCNNGVNSFIGLKGGRSSRVTRSSCSAHLTLMFCVFHFVTIQFLIARNVVDLQKASDKERRTSTQRINRLGVDNRRCYRRNQKRNQLIERSSRVPSTSDRSIARGATRTDVLGRSITSIAVEHKREARRPDERPMDVGGRGSAFPRRESMAGFSTLPRRVCTLRYSWHWQRRRSHPSAAAFLA